MTVERNIRLLIAFDGTNFNGWQRQTHDSTIQGEIEKCLSLMTNSEVLLHGAGRTDAGVHAEGMVANFITVSRIQCMAFKKGLNSLLPDAIRIICASEMPADFHARFSAKGKQYEYSIYAGEVMPPLERLYALQVQPNLDFAAMIDCLQIIMGTHDFSTFENSGSRDKDKPSRKGAIRTINAARLIHHDDNRHSFVFIGDGFLRHMIRNIVGTLLEVGQGKRSIAEFRRALEEKDRNAGGATAPPHGLKLHKVLY